MWGEGGKMKKVVYFGKINISTQQVYELYNGVDIHEILTPVFSKFNNALKYVYNYTFMYENAIVESSITYSVHIKEKTDTYIWGFLDKESRLPYKQEDISGELVTKFVPNTERVEFYYDVFKEIVGYYTSNRFGRKEVLEVFQNLLDSFYDEEEFPITFSVSRYTHGLSIKQIEKELKEIKNIQKLRFTVRPVNPDTKLLKKIQNNGKGKLEEFEDANLSVKHVELTSASRLGLNLDSNLVKDEINYAATINDSLTMKDSTSNGYVKIEATGRDGITYSTEDRAQVKKEINNIIEFKKACQDLINRGK